MPAETTATKLRLRKWRGLVKLRHATVAVIEDADGGVWINEEDRWGESFTVKVWAWSHTDAVNKVSKKLNDVFVDVQFVIKHLREVN